MLLDLPRSVLLALWVASHDPVRAVAAVQGDDEPHTVVDADGEPTTLARWLAALGPADAVAGLLPVPGDALGVPAAVSSAAVDAGEAVLVLAGGAGLALVPEVRRFGSELEPGHLVTWQVTPVPDWRLALQGRLGSLADAERDLRQGLVLATEALQRLDVARWRPDAAALIGAVPRLELQTSRLPRDLDGRRARTLTSAARLRTIVSLAVEDDGGAVNLWQADQRTAALRDVDRVARAALCAAATTLDA